MPSARRKRVRESPRGFAAKSVKIAIEAIYGYFHHVTQGADGFRALFFLSGKSRETRPLPFILCLP